MNILVTGGNGYIGSNLVQGLCSMDENVHLIVRENSSLELLENVKSDITIHQYDGQVNQLVEIMVANEIELVIHLASLYVADHTMEQVEPLINSNVLFGTQLLEAMANSSTNKLVNIGTHFQHFGGEQYNPINLYAAMKEAFQNICKYYSEVHKIDMITLKLNDVYGPNDPRRKILTILLDACRKGERIDVSPGEQKMSLLYIDDVVKAIIRACEIIVNKDTGNKSYFIPSDENVSLKELSKIIEKVCNKNMIIHFGGRAYRNREMMTPYFGDKLPGWQPKICLEEGIRKLLDSQI